MTNTEILIAALFVGGIVGAVWLATVLMPRMRALFVRWFRRPATADDLMPEGKANLVDQMEGVVNHPYLQGIRDHCDNPPLGRPGNNFHITSEELDRMAKGNKASGMT